MEKTKYQCKNCGWETSIRQEWSDLKPKRCMNKKCNTSFLANRDALIITRPESKVEQKDKKDGKASRKHQNRSQTNEQQTKE